MNRLTTTEGSIYSGKILHLVNRLTTTQDSICSGKIVQFAMWYKESRTYYYNRIRTCIRGKHRKWFLYAFWNNVTFAYSRNDKIQEIANYKLSTVHSYTILVILCIHCPTMMPLLVWNNIDSGIVLLSVCFNVALPMKTKKCTSGIVLYFVWPSQSSLYSKKEKIVIGWFLFLCPK